MRAMRKWDIYGNMQRWIMTVKDHSTWLVYLCALPQKKAIVVAAKLEKYFGLIGYLEIFHTDMFTFPFMLSQYVYFISVLLIVLYISLFYFSIQTMGKSSLQQLLLTYSRKITPTAM